MTALNCIEALPKGSPDNRLTLSVTGRPHELDNTHQLGRPKKLSLTIEFPETLSADQR